MQVEKKAAIYSYIKDLENKQICHPSNSHDELIKRFALTEEQADIIVNMYIRENVENKTILLEG